MSSRRPAQFIKRLCILLGAAAAISAPVWLSSCKTEILPVKEPKKCDLQVVSLTVISSPLINPTTETGETRPVQLRIYQLTTDTRLQNASFEQIWKKDKETLGEDLVKVDELPIYPNTRTEVKFERDESAQNVVGVALFRNPKGKSWFTVFELPPSPAKGQGCGAPECKEGDSCDAGPGPILNPRFSLWLDGTLIEAGDDHLDDVPADGGRVSIVHLTGGGKPAGSAAAPAGSKK
jgi:type VI secretion system protein VasD